MTFIPAELLGVDRSAIFHVGYVVEDLADAMAQLTDTLGTRWVDHFVDVRYRSDSGLTIETRLHTTARQCTTSACRATTFQPRRSGSRKQSTMRCR